MFQTISSETLKHDLSDSCSPCARALRYSYHRIHLTVLIITVSRGNCNDFFVMSVRWGAKILGMNLLDLTERLEISRPCRSGDGVLFPRRRSAKSALAA